MNGTPGPGQRLPRKKPLANIAGGHGGHDGALRRHITLFQLAMFGTGATIGTGMFFVLGQQVPVAVPLFPLLAILCLISSLSPVVFTLTAIRAFLAAVPYFSYSSRHSVPECREGIR